ncbi:hypothetical protein ONZ45_g15822 [Pleurotus djamor]|nr:hypothetical protein ONZ45_g15822 [Pleurotus djamor]
MNSFLHLSLYRSPRLLPNQGYFEDPGFIPHLTVRLPHNAPHYSSHDVVFGPDRYEVWSLNSSCVPVYPGSLLRSLHLENIPSIVPHFDGTLGPLDPTLGPQLFNPEFPWLPCVERSPHPSRSSRPEHRSLSSLHEIWCVDDPERGRVYVKDYFVEELGLRLRELACEMVTAIEDLFDRDSELAQTLWSCRPNWPSELRIESWSSILHFEESLDLVSHCQRGLRLRQGWLHYVQDLLKDSDLFPDPSLVMSHPVPRACSNRMGFFMTDAALPYLRVLLFASNPSPCYVVHQYTIEERPYHQDSPLEFGSDKHDIPATLLQGDDSFFLLARRSSRLILEGDSLYARVRSPADSHQPYADALSLSFRQGLRSSLFSLSPSIPSTPLPAPSAPIEEEDRALDPLYAPYTGVFSKYWRIETLPTELGSSKALADYLCSQERQIKVDPEELLVLRTKQNESWVYWVRFDSPNLAASVRGLLLTDRGKDDRGFSGSLVPEGVFESALTRALEGVEETLGIWHPGCTTLLRGMQRQLLNATKRSPDSRSDSRRETRRIPSLSSRLSVTLIDRIDTH